MRQTNKVIIRELLPKLHAKVARYEQGETCMAHDTSGKLFISETKYFWHGKYDSATLSLPVSRPKEQGAFYSKEYVGCGNGYYALVDYRTGKIIAGEWD